MIDVTSAQVIDAAIERLHRVGWTQQDPGPAEGPNCLLGALSHGFHDLTSYRSEQVLLDYPSPVLRMLSRTQIEVVKAIHRFENEYFSQSAAVWNDAPGRTLEDVLLVLKDAQTRLEAEAV